MRISLNSVSEAISTTGNGEAISSRASARRRLAAAVASAVAIGAPLTATHTWAQDTEAPASRTLDQIVVTAQRREAGLQDASVAVSAFTGEDLARRQIVSANSIGLSTPGLVSTAQIGQPSGSLFYLRGAGQNDALTTLEPGVGVYVDDVYMARVVGVDRAFYDSERVEVLRGPQGTLYGRNSVGGAIKVYSVQPKLDVTESHLEAGLGNYDRLEYKLMHNQPLSDKLAFRIATSGEFQGRGTHAAPALGTRVNAPDKWGVRAILRYQPTDLTDVRIRLDYNDFGGKCCYGASLPDTVTLNSAGRPVTDGNYSSRDLFVYSGSAPARNDSTDYGIHLNVDHDFGNFTLSSITAYRYADQDLLLDFTGGPGQFNQTIDHRQFSQEFQFGGNAFQDRLDWVFGAFYMRDDAENISGFDLQNLGFFLGEQLIDNTTDAYALFGDIKYSFSDRVRGIVGARLTYENRKLDTAGYPGRIGTVPPSFTTQTLIDNGIPMDRSFNNFSPKLGLEWDLNDDMMLYVVWSEGFKSGGWSSRVYANPAQFSALDEERITSTEIGFKSEWANRIRVNIAAFNADYEDFVVNRVFVTPSGAVTSRLNNAAEAYVRGIELEATAVLSDNFSTFLMLNRMQSKIERIEGDTGLIEPGNRVNNTPEWKAQIGLDGDFSAPSLGGNITGRVTVSYQDRYFAGNENLPLTFIEESTRLDAFVRYERGTGDSWYTEVYCTNCGNENYYYARLNIPPGRIAYAAPVRMYGIRFGIRM